MAHAADGAPFEAAKMSLPAEAYWSLRGPGVVTAEGRALCDAMMLPKEFPCDAHTILDAARQQTDRELWIDRLISGIDNGQDAPAHCPRPVVLEVSPSKDGSSARSTIGCHSALASETLTSETVDRLVAAGNALLAVSPKTLRQHQDEARLARFIEYLESATK